MLPYLLIGFFSCSTIPCGKFFLFFKVHLIWAAKGGGDGRFLFLRHSLWGVQIIFFNCTKEKWMLRWFIQCLKETDLLEPWVSYFVCKKKKKRQNRGGMKVTCFGVLFFLYIGICRLDDPICMVMAWKNYDVSGSSTILYLCLLFCFCYVQFLCEEWEIVFHYLRILSIPRPEVLL